MPERDLAHRADQQRRGIGRLPSADGSFVRSARRPSVSADARSGRRGRFVVLCGRSHVPGEAGSSVDRPAARRAGSVNPLAEARIEGYTGSEPSIEPDPRQRRTLRSDPASDRSPPAIAGSESPIPMNTFVVRYGQMRLLGEYEVSPAGRTSAGSEVVVRSDRGTELGEVLCPATDRTAAFLENPVPGRDPPGRRRPRIWRRRRGWPTRRRQGFAACREFIARRRLQMDLVDVEAIFGGERMVFYYLAEKRVDFRELVKDLARALADPDRDAADRRPRRGQAPGRLRRLRQAGLLQHPPVADAAGLDADGQDPENDARPLENLGPVW